MEQSICNQLSRIQYVYLRVLEEAILVVLFSTGGFLVVVNASVVRFCFCLGYGSIRVYACRDRKGRLFFDLDHFLCFSFLPCFPDSIK